MDIRNGNGVAGLLGEVPCHDPWWLGYSLPNCQHLACQSLTRVGFEAWYPIKKIVARKPQSRLPSKTRHRRKFEVVERTAVVFGTYLFARRRSGAFDPGTVRELHGIGGWCKLGDAIATIKDFEIELLKLAESRGRFNEFHVSVPNTYRLSVEPDPRSWVGTTRPPGDRQTIAFCAELARVCGIVAADAAGRGAAGVRIGAP
jgi:hypothetical protein